MLSQQILTTSVRSFGQFIKCWFKSLIKITLKPLASNIVAIDDNNYRDSHNCKSMHVIVLGKKSKTETV